MARPAPAWRVNVAEPILATKPDSKFFNKLGKKASSLSQRCAQFVSRFGNRSRRGVLYDRDGLKIETLEYATCADYAPVPDLKASLTFRAPDGAETTKPLTMAFPFEGAMVGGDPLATTRKSQRVKLDNGVRVASRPRYSAEARAFAQVVPQPGTSDVAVLMIDGVRYELALDDLTVLAQYGDLDAQLESLGVRREEIQRRLDQERDYVLNAEEPVDEPETAGDSDDAPDETNEAMADEADEAAGLRPLRPLGR